MTTGEGQRPGSTGSALRAMQGLENQMGEGAVQNVQKVIDESAQRAQAAVAPPAAPATNPLTGGVQPPETPPAPPASVEPPAVETPPAAPPVETPPAVETPAEEKVVIESPLFGGIKEITKPIEAGDQPGGTSSTLSFEKIDDLTAHLEKEYGIKGGISELDGKLKQISKVEQERQELSEKYSNVERFFESMPKKLYEAVDLYQKGEDWESVIARPSIDFTKEAKDFSGKQLVDMMVPGKLTNEDWEQYNDPEGDPAVKRLVESTVDVAKNTFSEKKNLYNAELNSRVQKAKDTEKLVQASFSEAKSEIKALFPEAQDSYIGDIEKMFSEKTIYSLFYNEDGTLKKDAMARAAMARDGKALVDQYQGILERKIETRLNQELLSRGAEAPTVSQGSASGAKKEETRKEVQDIVEGIRGLIPSQTF